MTDDDRILEWCGFKQGAVNTWTDPEGVLVDKPTINLEFLFEQVKKKMLWFKVLFEHIEVSCEYYVTLTDFYLAQPCKHYKAKHKDPVEALKQALLKVIENG